MKTILALLAPVLLLAGPSPAPQPAPVAPPAEVPMPAPHTITPFLWFDSNAEEAIAFYASIFPDTKVLSESRWGAGGPAPAGSLMTATFRLGGHEYMALNGGPMYRFNEAFSLMVSCETQAEVDELWAKLTAGGGEPGQCGWLKDRFGLSWQVVPSVLPTLLADPDPARAARVGQAMRNMGKLDIAALQAAADGR